VLVGDIFRSAGQEVRYALEAGNADTLAAYAHLDGAHVLSNDPNLLRFVQLAHL
jgi:hypothetical protein